MKKLFSLFLLVAFGSLYAQNSAELIDWKVLAQVDFKDQYFEQYEAWYLVPEFKKDVKKLEGKTVMIKGYVIPLDVDGGQYALSAYPFSACFFCGGAGPESVMSLEFSEKPRRYKTDEQLFFKGKLELNNTDVDRFNYILNECEEVED
jgi:hypothetical protein